MYTLNDIDGMWGIQISHSGSIQLEWSVECAGEAVGGWNVVGAANN